MGERAREPVRPAGQPGHRRGVGVVERLLAVLALALVALLVVIVAALVFTDLTAIVVGLLGVAVFAAGAWWAVTERMPRRAVGVVGALVGVATIAGALVLAADEGDHPVTQIVVVLLVGLAAVGVARLAVTGTIRRLDVAADLEAYRPRRPVLLANPRSGGGTVVRTRLDERARDLGVEVVLLEPGLDLEQLARDAVARGADCLGMAGGDGSQALVASVAIEHGLPFVCISAGTRNHFALDLGLDRDDPVGGLTAFTDGVLRRVDVARVNGRVFVNNASLGVYGEVVAHEEYRDAKAATALSALPELIGDRAEPYDLQFQTPDGREVDGAFLVMVSNNPYVLGASPDVAQRRTMTSGVLGVVAISSRTGADAAALATRAVLGLGGRDPHLHEFTCTQFEVASRSGTARVGVDGEALELAVPVRFTIEPGALTILVPRANPSVTLARHYRALGLGGLVRIALGHDPAAMRQSVESVVNAPLPGQQGNGRPG